MDGGYFPDFFWCQVTAGVPLSMSSLLPFVTSCGQRLKNHSGISWNGKPDIVSQVFGAVADTSGEALIPLVEQGEVRGHADFGEEEIESEDCERSLLPP